MFKEALAEYKRKEAKDKIEIAKLIEKYFPKEIKIKEIQHYPFMDKGEYGVVIFHITLPHRPIPLVWNVEKQEIELFDEKAERNLKELEEKGIYISSIVNFINHLEYKNLIRSFIQELIEKYELSDEEGKKSIAERLKKVYSENEDKFIEEVIKKITYQEGEDALYTLAEIRMRKDLDDIDSFFYKVKYEEDREALEFIEDVIIEALKEF